MNRFVAEPRISTETRRWVLFAAVSVFFGLSMFYRTSIAVITTDLIRDIDFDAETLSLASAAFFYAYALMQIPVGMLLDRVGPARTMTPLYIVAFLGVILFARADSPGLTTLGRFLMGIGMACSFVGALKLLTLWFNPARFATLAAMIIAVGSIGTVAATTPLAFAAGLAGWRLAFVAVAFFHLALILVFAAAVGGRGTLSPALPESSATDRWNPFAGLRLVIRKRDFWLISLAAFCRSGVFTAVQGLWAGPYLVNVLGLSTLAAGNLLFLSSLGLILGGPVSGYLSDNILKARKGIMLGALLGLSAALTAMAWLPFDAGDDFAFGVLFIVFGVFGSTGSIPYAHLKEQMPAELAATSMTAMNFFVVLGMGVFMQGLGIFMQTLYPASPICREAFVAVFSLCATMVLVAAILYAFTKESHPGRE
jgi:MFS family permease